MLVAFAPFSRSRSAGFGPLASVHTIEPAGRPYQSVHPARIGMDWNFTRACSGPHCPLPQRYAPAGRLTSGIPGEYDYALPMVAVVAATIAA